MRGPRGGEEEADVDREVLSREASALFPDSALGQAPSGSEACFAEVFFLPSESSQNSRCLAWRRSQVSNPFWLFFF